MKKLIVFFDGYCNFCNYWVDFLLKRDKDHRFQFATLQGKTAKELLPSFSNGDTSKDSVILLEGEKIYTHSSAALRICKQLGGFWKLCYALIAIPKFLRDPVYNWVARNRYKWFGRKETCRVPAENEKRRFLE